MDSFLWEFNGRSLLELPLLKPLQAWAVAARGSREYSSKSRSATPAAARDGLRLRMHAGCCCTSCGQVAVPHKRTDTIIRNPPTPPHPTTTPPWRSKSARAHSPPTHTAAAPVAPARKPRAKSKCSICREGGHTKNQCPKKPPSTSHRYCKDIGL